MFPPSSRAPACCLHHTPAGRDVELCPLLSVDIDSSGQRLATTASDNKIRIWNMGPILDPQKELDPSVPKLLATLTDHFEPVNVARFSPDGRFIASGSDSKMVRDVLRGMLHLDLSDPDSVGLTSIGLHGPRRLPILSSPIVLLCASAAQALPCPLRAAQMHMPPTLAAPHPTPPHIHRL